MEIQLTTQHLRVSSRGIEYASDIKSTDLQYAAYRRLKAADRVSITHKGRTKVLKGDYKEV